MIRIRTMTLDDIPLGMRLKEQVGWNQTQADWQRFLEMTPGGSFMASLDGRDVGTIVTTVFGAVGWIAMVLVDPSARGGGIGSVLMRHALEHLKESGIATVRLDATASGKPLYEKLDFVVEYELQRFDGVIVTTANGPAPFSIAGEGRMKVRPAAASDLDAIVEVDAQATGQDRRNLVGRFLEEFPQTTLLCVQDGKAAGYVTERPGTLAIQIGPAIALNDDAGVALLDMAARSRVGQRVFVDVPIACNAAVASAQRQGLTVQRPLVRMCLGPCVRDIPKRIFASSGPEKG